MSARPLVLLSTSILTPHAPRADAWNLFDLEDDSGIYGLFDADKLIYVGKARSLVSRLQQHQTAMKYGRGQDFTAYACMVVPEEEMGRIEIAHIYALRPPNNRLYEPVRWAGHDALVGQIKEAWSAA